MIIDEIFLLKLSKDKGRFLGVDLGQKTIGLSICDETKSIATPLSLIERKNSTLDEKNFLDVIKNFDVKAVVIGYPLHMNGSKGESCFRVDCFIAKFDLPFFLWDERLSTSAVERTLLDANISRTKRKKHVDKMAASFILQGVLDRLKSIKNA